MGNCFSDPSKPSSSGQKLGSGPTPSQPTSGSAPSRPAQPAAPPRTLGGADYGTSGEGVPLGVDERDARDRALRAAEERAKAATKKGVTTSNPRAGQLSAKLAAERKVSPTSPKQGDERMMDRGDWN